MEKDKNLKQDPNADSQDIHVDWAIRVNQWKNASLKSWRQKHFDWYKYDNFYKGNHYTYYETSTGKLVNQTQGVTVNLCQPIIRGIANNLSKIRPKWSFQPTSGADDNKSNVLKLSKLMDNYYDSLQMKRLLRDVSKQALKFSGGIVFIGWNDSKKDGKGDVDIKLENNFYWLPDPAASDLEDCRYVVRIVEAVLQDVKANTKYDKILVNKLNPEEKMGATPIYEDVIVRSNKIESSKMESSRQFGKVFITECYVKEYEDVDATDMAGNPIKKKVSRIRLVCECQGHILYNELTNLEDYPFEVYYSDKDAFSMFGEGWMKNLIPLNQVINKHETHKLEYIEKLNKGAFILQKGSTLTVGKVNGIPTYIVDSKYSQEVKQMDMRPLPSTIDSSLNSFNGYMETIGGLSQAARGQAPAGVTAGIAIEALIDADANNTIELKENMENFLSRVAKKVLWNIAKYQITSEELVYEEDEETKTMKYISKESEMALTTMDETSEASDILMIGTTNRVRVTIETDLAYTNQGRRETLDRLYNMRDSQGQSVIDKQTLLEGYNFGNVKEILERVRLEEIAAREEQLRQEAQSKMIQDGTPPAPLEDEVAPEEEAPQEPNSQQGYPEEYALRQQVSKILAGQQ